MQFINVFCTFYLFLIQLRSLSAVCSTPPISENVAYHPNQATYNSEDIIYYACANRLNLIPAEQVSNFCTANGSWNITSAPTCQPVCQYPPDVTSGQGSVSPNQQTYQPDLTVNYICSSTSFVLGNANTTCQNGNFQWSNSPPECVPGCPPPPAPMNNATQIGSHPTGYSSRGTQVQYGCDAGFSVQGTDTLTCSASAVWIPASAPTCVRVCGNPPPATGTSGSFSPTLPYYPVGTEIKYTCSGAYNVRGPGVNTCKSDGTWKYVTGTTCEAVCFTPPNIQHGTYQPQQVYYGVNTTLVYTCQTGYVLSSTASVVCDHVNLSWNNIPQCLKRDTSLDVVFLLDSNDGVEGTSCTLKESELNTLRPFGPGGVFTSINFPVSFQLRTFLESFQNQWRTVEPSYTRLAIQNHDGMCSNGQSASIRTLASTESLTTAFSTLQMNCGTAQALAALQCVLSYQLQAAQGERPNVTNAVIVVIPDITSAPAYSLVFRNAYLTGLSSIRSSISDIFTISTLRTNSTNYQTNKSYLEEFACGVSGNCTRFIGSVFSPTEAINRMRSYYQP
uniref:sushi, von Willebrand factor type A, EGF and pentraxin domain-containing protein 1-like n=1 Tax=Ciona intestinalis TaxID=7719 RepID=UPI000EF45C11|nr:sushi, von Willebrand factor type A, EGF and pentraxin domain-containing protein 1-like [Ciona intestinalis]|eukprot:XP_026690049.1 sushi, von Willebrand factor type A, EGF and pentraxin domain-containing protein 1-like [Ciona intestinalis]